MTDALALLAGLHTPHGLWGETATDAQWTDAREVLTGTTHRHWLGRARGFNKTGDAAAFTVAAMLHLLPEGSRGFCAAGDRDQARILADAMGSILNGTPGLSAAFEVQAWRIVARQRGVVLEVLSADGATSFGITPDWMVLDEFCQWPNTHNARLLHESLLTALPKRPGARCVVISTAGQPGSWQHREIEKARASSLWRVHEIEGPPPWMPAELIEEERHRLPESSFRRWFLNEWVESEDALAGPADIEAAVAHEDFLDPTEGMRYVIGVDLGTRHDPTAVVVAHADTTVGPEPVLMVDRVQSWQGCRRDPVDLVDIETWLASAAREYNGARVRIETWQGAGMVQRLRKAGVRAEEVFPTQAGSSKRATSLHLALRDRRLRLPRHEGLRSELQRVVVKETGPNMWRLDHRAGEHNDLVIALGLAAETLLEQRERPKITRGYSTRDLASGRERRRRRGRGAIG